MLTPACLNHSVDAPTGKLMMLPTDVVLLEDKKFSKWVSVYAKDGQKFNADFSKAFQKLEELGTKNLTPTLWA
jgi:cytochrome c peroxidase